MKSSNECTQKLVDSSFPHSLDSSWKHKSYIESVMCRVTKMFMLSQKRSGLNWSQVKLPKFQDPGDIWTHYLSCFCQSTVTLLSYIALVICKSHVNLPCPSWVTQSAAVSHWPLNSALLGFDSHWAHRTFCEQLYSTQIYHSLSLTPTQLHLYFKLPGDKVGHSHAMSSSGLF